MIERLLETWLNRANERSFQLPYAQCLAMQGHTVLHVSRHCGMELGKDIISIAPDKVPCAFQLKGVGGGRLTLSKWRDDLGKQLHSLVHTKIVHPSLSSGQHHRSYIVLNGTLEEEVQHEIDGFNRANRDAGQADRIVEVVVFGQLFGMFKEMFTALPFVSSITGLHDVKTYLEVFLDDGKGTLPKDKISKLYDDALPFETSNGKAPSKAEVLRSFAGGAVLCAATTSAFTVAQNHVAEVEAWMLYWLSMMGLLEKWGFDIKMAVFALDVASEAMFTALSRLCDELMNRTHLIEGSPLTDRFVYGVRITHLLGLMGLYGLWTQWRLQCSNSDVVNGHLEFARDFCDRHRNERRLWGEYAVPQFLALNFFRRTYDAGPAPIAEYATLIEGLCSRNHPKSKEPLANPYYDAESILPHAFGLATKPLKDSFAGKSYYLEGLMNLFIRGNFKQHMKLIFPDITRIGFRSYQPTEAWRFFRYNNWGIGTDVTRFLVPPHQWRDLKNDSEECQGNDLPNRMKEYPIHYLALLIVMPHRITASGLRWLATKMDQHAYDKAWQQK